MKGFRPYIPIPTRIAVAARQFGLIGVETYELLLIALTFVFGGKPYHLDHDPPLASRQKVLDRDGTFLDYDPPANSRDHLAYRAFESHRVKTYIRGDHGQLPDRVLINRAKRKERESGGRVKPKAKIRGLTFQQQRCRMGARCACDARQRKRCKHYRS